jgi:hypothetical protein
MENHCRDNIREDQLTPDLRLVRIRQSIFTFGTAIVAFVGVSFPVLGQLCYGAARRVDGLHRSRIFQGISPQGAQCAA